MTSGAPMTPAGAENSNGILLEDFRGETRET
jgi:hypothetical protein